MSVPCSCRTAALRIFLRSITQTRIAEDKLARTTWYETRRQVLNRNIAGWPAGLSHRQLHTSAPAHTPSQAGLPSATLEKVEGHDSYGEGGGLAPEAVEAVEASPSEGHAQESEPQDSRPDDEKLLGARRLSENASGKTARKTARYSELPKSPRTMKKSDGRGYGERTEIRKTARDETVTNKKRESKHKPMWAIQKEALKKKFPEGWKPYKRLSPDALAGIRALNQQFPDMYTTEALAQKFEVSPEAIRRILRSKWEPNADEEEDRQERWYNRGLRVWERYAELGKTPPLKWRKAIDEKDEEEVDETRASRLKTRKRLGEHLM